MEVMDKYLPPVEDRKLFLQNRINEYKKQMYGGVVEIRMAESNGEKRTVVTTEDMLKQLMDNIDIMIEELDKLE